MSSQIEENGRKPLKISELGTEKGCFNNINLYEWEGVRWARMPGEVSWVSPKQDQPGRGNSQANIRDA